MDCASLVPPPSHEHCLRSLLPLSEISAPRNAFLLPWLLFFSLHFQLRLGLRLFLFVLIVKPTGPQTEMIKQPVDDLHLVDRGRLPPQTLQPLHHRNVVDRLLARFNQPTRAALPKRLQNISLGHETPLLCLKLSLIALVSSSLSLKSHSPGSVPPATPPAQSASGCRSSAGYAGPVASAAAPSAADLAQHPPDPAPSAEPSATDHPLSAVPPAPDQPSHASYPVPVAAPACAP